MKTMAEVIEAHWSASTHADRKPFVDKCDGCGAVIMTWGEGGDMPALLVAHQTDALTTAGFGPVKAAQAGAWDEAIEAYKAWMWDDGNIDPLSNPYRAASIEADQ